MLALVITLAVSLPAVSFTVAIEPGQQLVYHGNIAQRNIEPGAASPQQKSFDLTWFVAAADASGTTLYWLVEERGRGAWPWPERFGRLKLDAQGRPPGSMAPSLLYNYGEGESIVPLPVPIVSLDAPLAAGGKFSQAGFDYEVQAEQKVEGHDAWRVQMGNSYGVKRTMFVDKHAPLLVALAERVFMNKGTEYVLDMKLSSVEKSAEKDCAATIATLDALVALRENLHRPPQSPDVEWNREQIALLTAALPGLQKQAEGGPLARLLAAAARDLDLQGGRAGEVADLVTKFQGQPLPELKLPGLAGGELTAADLRGQVAVLHFWEYRDEPLKEPYGQVGYLEFLHQKRKEQGVKVYGVAVDSRLGDEGERRAALSSIRKLKNFMNLSYPLVLDSGAAIKALGDPRIVGATLPLVVVVGRDGRIAHYHVGYYEIDKQQGLKELDAAVSAALAK